MPMMRAKLRCVVIILFLFTAACASTGGQPAANAPEASAHDFVLPDQDGQMVRLSEVLDAHDGVVIAFYPKDDSRY